MPVKITKKDGGFSVSTPGGVKAKDTSYRNAMAQKRLLQGVEHGWKPTGAPAKKQLAMRARASVGA
jgi:hypothetical protein